MLVLALSLAFAAATPAECLERYEKEAAGLEKYSTAGRLQPALLVIAEACPLIPSELRDAARRASKASRKDRLLILGSAVQKINGPACQPHAVADPARGMATECPFPEDMPMNEGMLEDLDQGTYAFSIALVRAMEKSGVLVHGGRMVLSNFLLAAALDGHAAKPSKTKRGG